LPKVVIVIKSRKGETGRILSTQWRKEKFIEVAMQDNIFSNTAARTINLLTDRRVWLKPLMRTKLAQTKHILTQA